MHTPKYAHKHAHTYSDAHNTFSTVFSSSQPVLKTIAKICLKTTHWVLNYFASRSAQLADFHKQHQRLIVYFDLNAPTLSKYIFALCAPKSSSKVLKLCASELVHAHAHCMFICSFGVICAQREGHREASNQHEL